ncbi:SUPPRESSOR OF GAMMA RESPONSE 1-like [Primulina eburnea]|uniref:SUPPRESSOR OF GAMMA RESPONSE 1-like n=1 Tax=Primulina eburnea TaxID=1245227 RepID=UPI003C6C96F8
MARTWLIDGKGIAKKVKNAGLPAAYQIKDCGANKKCPNCHYHIDNTHVSREWPGLPVGVKFDPSDVELLEHLAAKCEVGDSEPHLFIDEFIPTLEGDEGICYTHPENLPGAKKDGSSVHFFYRIINAYASGHRKRRRINGQESTIKAHVRWHKTGKTKPVMDNLVLKGFKKIMVLYAPSKKGSKPDKCNWVMHQYHLGANEDEQGEYVVSIIFYQPQKETEYNETPIVKEESDLGLAKAIPKTPKMSTPDPPGPQNTPSFNGGSDDYLIKSFVQNAKNLKDPSDRPSGFWLEDEVEYAICLAGESQAADFVGVDSLFCNEIIDSNTMFGNPTPHNSSFTREGGKVRDVAASGGISDLDNIELDTPPDFNISDLQYASQDSVFDWLNQL